MTLATLKNPKCRMKHCELFWFTIIPTLQEAIHKVRSRVGCGNKNGQFNPGFVMSPTIGCTLL